MHTCTANMTWKWLSSKENGMGARTSMMKFYRGIDDYVTGFGNLTEEIKTGNGSRSNNTM